MLLKGVEGETLEIALAEGYFDPRAFDLRLIVKLAFHGFNAEIDAWVLQRDWTGFLKSLAELERTRQGMATLEAASPDALRLSFHSLDPAGHVAVDGFVGTQIGMHKAKLTFSAIEFDPTDLPHVLSDLRDFDARAR
jgi:hypothetical protein